MKLYNKEGYLDIPALLAQPETFIFIYGGRGVGKTYGALKAALDRPGQFIYARRLQSEADIISKAEYMPFNSLMQDDPDLHIGVKPVSKYNAAFYRQEETAEGWVNAGKPIGFTAALSTIAHMRGFDSSGCDLWIYDEFIPEEHVRSIKGEGAAFLNAYETMNRNRELQGRQPMKVLCLANSNRLANPIFVEMGLVGIAEKMKRKKINLWHQGDVLMVDPFDSPIGEEKEETVLYRVANKKSAFYQMAIGNAFQDLDQASTGSRPLMEFKPLVTIGELTVYRHKSDKSLHVSFHRMGSAPIYQAGGIELTRFKADYRRLWNAYLENRITFEDYSAEALFNEYWKG